MHSSTFVGATLGFALPIVAIPLNSDASTTLGVDIRKEPSRTQLPVRQDDKCSYPTDNPDALWDDVNAASFLKEFLEENGSDNWLHNMDQKLTDGGSQSGSNLDCVDFPNGNCQFPTVQCQDFTPQEMYYVRNAASAFYETMHAVFDELARFVSIDASLRISKVFDDFTAPPEPVSNPFPFITGAAILAGVIPGLGEIAGSVIGGLTFVSALLPKEEVPPIDPAKDIKSQLAESWDKESEMLKKYVEAVFSGKIPSDVGDAFGTTDAQAFIRDTFADGKWILPGELDENGSGPINAIVDPLMEQTGKTIMQSLALGTMRTNKHFFWVDKTLSEDECNMIEGSRRINDECYVIGWKGESWQDTGSRGRDLRKSVHQMDPDMITKLDDPSKGYEFDLDAFYRNAQDCANSGGGDVDMNNLTPIVGDSGTGYSKCFVNLKVLKGYESPCKTEPDGVHPSEGMDDLGFEETFCVTYEDNP